MTNSSSEGSAVPLDFHLSTSLEGDNSKLSSNTEDCPLCCKSRKTFYCRMCVRNGDFVHSTSHYVERFAEKQLRLMHMKRDRRDAEIIRGNQIDAFQHRTRLSGGIKMHKERISLLHLLIKGTRENVEKRKALAAQLADKNVISLMRLERYEERVRKLEGYVRDKSSEVEKQQQKVKIVCSELKKVVRMSISQLVQYIFPISVVKPSRSQEDCDTVSALAEATRTAYFRGRWVFMDSSGELQHCIVAPTLPGSGNYSPYNDWVAANKDGVPGGSSEAVDHNPAYSISAALMYTTQLINVLAFYLDVRLPSKLCYSDFCGNDLSEQKFMKRVARLNWNVLHLCLTQSVNPQLLHPSQTLHNILHLLNTQISDLGRLGPVEVEPVIAKALEEQLLRRLEEASDDSDSEDDSDHLPCEWEAVPHVSLPEAPMPSQMSQAGVSVTVSASSSSVQTTSIAGGLVTSAAASIASIWRGWTAGNR